MSKSIDPSVKRRPLWRRALVISAQILIGTGLGAAASEYAFDRRDDGAFPHVNFYLPDPELGVPVNKVPPTQVWTEDFVLKSWIPASERRLEGGK